MFVENKINVEGSSLDSELASEFAVQNGPYYARQFEKLGEAYNYTWTFNWAAALLGPIWMASRNLWSIFWLFLVAELVALVQLSRGLFGDLGAEQLERVHKLTERAAVRAEESRLAFEQGSTNAAALQRSSLLFEKGAVEAQAAADAAIAQAPLLVLTGLVLLLVVKTLEGSMANWSLEGRFMAWRSNRRIRKGLHGSSALGGFLLVLLTYPVTLFRFTAAKPPAWLTSFPAERSLHTDVSNWVDGGVDWLTINGESIFSSIRTTIRVLLDGLETVLLGTPWPVIMLVIIVLAWRLAGLRVAIFTVAALAYLSLLGFWEKSMITVALLGSAAFICILLGIPLGIWCAKNKTAYIVVRPILDFMQTMPAFVYLIPVIAFFGTGKPPGVIATLVFGMPPVVRLTVLGLQGVPQSVIEATTAFGASKRFLLFKVELPLALPSIMTGINQTILMCLSMVVIASLIGAKGLGEDVLEALQYAAEGQGIVAGLAILCCAMVLDRIVQGKSTR